MISKRKHELTLQLLNIQHNCEHKIVVRYNDVNSGREVRCLNCNKTFYGNVVGIDFYFKNIIDLQNLTTDGDKVEIALKLFEEEKNQHPDLNDAKIVKIINDKVKENKVFTEESEFVKTVGKK